MIITPEIESIVSDPDRISELDFTYQNGGKVKGKIRKLKYDPLRLVIQKSSPNMGERPKHRVVFDHVTHLRVTFNDGSEQNFPGNKL